MKHLVSTIDIRGQLLMGKSQEEVLRLIGRPDSTQDYTRWQNWFYRHITYDPISRKPDYTANVVIEYGKVSDISF